MRPGLFQTTIFKNLHFSEIEIEKMCEIGEKIQILYADYNYKNPTLCDLCHTQSENPFITQWGRKHLK